MASCKDCLHYDVCKALEDEVDMYTASYCGCFKDKSRYIELPCKVGDTVYYITGIGHNLVKPAKVKEIILDENGIKDLYVQGNGHNFENSFDIFFLTYEEAEKKLEEFKDENII